MSVESEEQPISVASYDGYQIEAHWVESSQWWAASATGASIANISGQGDTKEEALTNLTLSLCRFLDAVNPNAPAKT